MMSHDDMTRAILFHCWLVLQCLVDIISGGLWLGFHLLSVQMEKAPVKSHTALYWLILTFMFPFDHLEVLQYFLPLILMKLGCNDFPFYYQVHNSFVSYFSDVRHHFKLSLYFYVLYAKGQIHRLWNCFLFYHQVLTQFLSFFFNLMCRNWKMILSFVPSNPEYFSF